MIYESVYGMRRTRIYADLFLLSIHKKSAFICSVCVVRVLIPDLRIFMLGIVRC